MTLRGSTLLVLLVGIGCGGAPARGPHDPPPLTGHDLYALLMRVATHPELADHYAPGAEEQHHGGGDETSPIGDAVTTFGWMRDMRYVTAGELATSQDESSDCACDPAALRCTIAQPGGTTIVQFEWHHDGAAQRLVIRRVETEDP